MSETQECPRCGSLEVAKGSEWYNFLWPRGAGLSTALVFEALGKALMNPGQHIEFKDHWKMDSHRARNWRHFIQDKIEKNGLINMRVWGKGNHVFLANDNPLKVREYARKAAEKEYLENEGRAV